MKSRESAWLERCVRALARARALPTASATVQAFVRAVALTGALAWALSGCQSYSPNELRVGDTEGQVVGLMGSPTDRIGLPDGVTRLVYARGPMGKHTYMIDLGPDGGVQQWRQVLGEAAFSDIQPGWTMEQMRREFGPPADKRPYRPRNGQIWAYRYPTYECQWFLVDFGPDEKVVSTSYGIDPLCDSPM